MRRVDAVVIALWLVAVLARDLVTLYLPGSELLSVVILSGVVGWLMFVLPVWVAYRIWRRLTGRAGGLAALLAAVLFAAAVVLLVVIGLVDVGALGIVLVGEGVFLAAKLCLAYSLLRGRLVPSWVPWVGAAAWLVQTSWGVLTYLWILRGSSITPTNGVLWQLFSWAGTVATVAELVFIAALGVCLFWKAPAPQESDGSIEPAPGT